MSLTAILIIAALVALNGLFVAAEFAIVGAPKASIDRLARRGSRAAGAVRRVLDNPRQQDRFIATAQLGITLASLGLGMYGEHILAQWLFDRFSGLGFGQWAAAHTVASVIAVLVLTYFHIVLGEMVPKSIALQRAQHTALWIVPVMRVVQLALYPLVILLNGVGNGLLRLMGVHRSEVSGEHYRTPDELAYLVRETVAGGLLRAESAQVVQELFEFGGLTAGEVMVPRVRAVGLPLGTSREQLRVTLEANAHTRYPVYEGSMDRIVGVVHVKELLRLLAGGADLGKEHIRPVPYIPATAGLDQVLAAMGRGRSQLVVAMDEHGGTAGIITVEDLFEEVVGDFGEDPLARKEQYVDAEGRQHVVGTVRLEEIGAVLGVVLEHEEIDTAGGLVLAQLGRPPVVGDVVVYDDVRFEVFAVEGHGVADTIVSALPHRSE